MKKCIKCQKDVPDHALHCVFCGANQSAPSGSSKPAAKTVMGYEAADVLAQMKAEQDARAAPAGSPAAAPAPQAPTPDIAEVETLHAGSLVPAVQRVVPAQPTPPAPAPHMAQTVAAAVPAASVGAPTAAAPPAHMAQTVAAPLGVQHPANAAPAPVPAVSESPAAAPGQPAHMVHTVAAPGAGNHAVMGAPPPAAAPAMAAPPAMAPPMAAPHMAAPHMAAPPMAAPHIAPQPGGPARKQAAPTPPPYLASQTHNRIEAPQEPWAGTLELMMRIFGAALVLFFVLPWALAPETHFSWHTLGEAEGVDKLPPLLLVGSGVLALVLSRLPLSVKGYGLSALVAGFAPLVLLALLQSRPSMVAAIDPTGIKWQLGVLALSSLTLIAGLLLRSQYHTALLPRLLVTVGVACLLIPQLLPDTLVLDALESIGDMSGKYKLRGIAIVVPTGLAAIGLILTWLPISGPVGTRVIAWILLIWPLVVTVTITLVFSKTSLGAAIKGGLDDIFWLPTATVAWACLTGYGLASFLGKSLEHP